LGSVYRYGGSYRIGVDGQLRKRFPKRGMRFRAPYRTLLTGASLDLIVLADAPPNVKNARPFEIAVDLHSTDTRVLGELVLLDWQIALDGAWLAKRLTYQPMGVWLYKGGSVVAACLRGTKRRPLKNWLAVGKEQSDPKLIEDLSGRTHPPEVKQATRAVSLRQGGKPVATLSPVRVLYPFRDSPSERMGFDPASVPDVTDVPAGRLPWRLLPPGELSVERLRHHYKALQHRNPHIRYDPERITKAYSLGPEQCYIGTDEFDGYVVFTFAGTDRTLLECPVYGNAIYVLGPDWRRLSKMSKHELLSRRPRGVNKIVHKGNWFGRAKLVLGIR
jgi:hypothetical protein